MDGFMNSINTGITASTIWGSIEPVAPLIITLFLVAVAVGVVRRNLTKGKKNKGGTV